MVLTFLSQVNGYTLHIVAAGCLLVFASGAYAFISAINNTKTNKEPSPSSIYKRLDLSAVYISPTTLPILGNLLDLFFKADYFFEWGCEQTLTATRQGKPWLLTAPWRAPVLVYSSVAITEDITKTFFTHFQKGTFLRMNLTDFLGQGVFISDGDNWVHQRKTASNLFTMRSLRDSFTVIMQKHGRTVNQILLEKAKQGEALDLCKLLCEFTIEAFAEIGFGVELKGLGTGTEHSFQNAFDSALLLLNKRFIVPTWVWKLKRLLNIGDEKALKQNMEVINELVFQIIEKSLERRNQQQQSSGNNREDLQGKHDLVSLFLDNQTQAPKDFDPVFLRDMVVNFLLAGRDTTAQTLSWYIYSLSQHPQVVQKIRQEIATNTPELLPGGSCDYPDMATVQQLPYLEATIKETLRLYPVIPMNPRQAVQDTVLSDGMFVPAGTRVILNSYAMGRMPEVWGPDATEYNPDRWIDPMTGKLKNVSSFQFNSFHSGPRICLGMNLAMLEMKLVAVGILSKFDLEIVPGQHVTYKRALTFPMKGALMVRPRIYVQ